MSILHITYLADQNIITIKEDVYSVLHLGMKMKFREEKYGVEDWKYTNIRQIGVTDFTHYKIYGDIII
jgi:hypothetical protein